MASMFNALTGSSGSTGVKNEVVYEETQALMEKLAVEALQVAMVKTAARIVEGDAGKAICKEAERVKPAAVVMGTRGRGILKRNDFRYEQARKQAKMGTNIVPVKRAYGYLHLLSMGILN